MRKEVTFFFLQQKKPSVNGPKQNGVTEHQSNSKEGSVGASESKGKENKEANQSQDDSDEHADSDKKKKGILVSLLSKFFHSHNFIFRIFVLRT